MKRSTDRILTTHTGSLPRPGDLAQKLDDRDHGRLAPEEMAGQITAAVAEIVRTQADCGVDVVNDGEMSKVGYSTYVKERLTGFGGESAGIPGPADLMEFPEYAQRTLGGIGMSTPACDGPIEFKGADEVQTDLDNLAAALEGTDITEAFISAASPGVVAVFLPNQYYGSEDEYLEAIGDAMKAEYDRIVAAGFLLQLDCPDLAMSGHIVTGGEGAAPYDKTAFRKKIARRIEVLNHATRDIPEEKIRLHLCWGNYEGPHHHDVPLEDIIDVLYTAEAQAYSFEAANPRHAHEWRVFEDHPLPDGKIVLPGVIDSTTNYVEHPQLIADRIATYARVVGRENVMAGSDCGFATFATYAPIEPGITWLKFKAMAEGARIASERLW